MSADYPRAYQKHPWPTDHQPGFLHNWLFIVDFFFLNPVFSTHTTLVLVACWEHAFWLFIVRHVEHVGVVPCFPSNQQRKWHWQAPQNKKQKFDCDCCVPFPNVGLANICKLSSMQSMQTKTMNTTNVPRPQMSSARAQCIATWRFLKALHTRQR